MDAYQIGKLFPIEQYCTGREMYVGLPTEGFFNVLISLKKISRRERKLFKNGKITALVSLRRGQKNIDSEDLRGFCESRLGSEKLPLPDILRIVPEIPIRATGKIDRKKIKGY